MASIVNRPNGTRWIQFTHPSDGRRRTLRLGKLSKRNAEAVAGHVESLAAAVATGNQPPPDALEWLARLPRDTVDKLAAVGLCQAPADDDAPRTLADVLDAVLDAKRADGLKPESLRKFRQTRDKLCRHFGPDADPATIDADGAAGWRVALKDSGLSLAAVKSHSGLAKTLWQGATTRGLVPLFTTPHGAAAGIGGPFAGLASGVTARANDRYVTPDDALKVTAELPDAEWRVLFGLAYWAGLRTPSETHGLTWRDVDWEKGRLDVASPKTERYAGHERRLVPVAPELMGLLRDAYDAAEEGATRIITLSHHDKRKVYETIGAAVRRANVEPWPALWQTLRDSCERRWAMVHPQVAVSRWIGHSIAVSGRHYANRVPDELFARAAATPADAHGGSEGTRTSTPTVLRVPKRPEALSEAVGARIDPHRNVESAFAGQNRGLVRVGAVVKGGGGENRTPVS